MNNADELDRFKRNINLVEYAESQGYVIDKNISSKSSTIMRRGYDKIAVATDLDGHGVYFNLKEDGDHGTIIDFVQRRKGFNLGQVRQELRPWIGVTSTSTMTTVVKRQPEAERPPKPERSTSDRQQVLAVYMKMEPQPVGGHPYLHEERKLKTATLEDPRFASMIRIDNRGNAVFPHFDRQGLSGYELKNEGFTGFSKGGEKAIWHSANLKNAPRIVITESAIDAMSHAQLTRDYQAAYISTGGSMSDKQRDLLQAAMAKGIERGAEIIIATDNDAPGEKLAEQLRFLVPPSSQLHRQAPEGKDWNDDLKNSSGGGIGFR